MEVVKSELLTKRRRLAQGCSLTRNWPTFSFRQEGKARTTKAATYQEQQRRQGLILDGREGSYKARLISRRAAVSRAVRDLYTRDATPQSRLNSCVTVGPWSPLPHHVPNWIYRMLSKSIHTR